MVITELAIVQLAAKFTATSNFHCIFSFDDNTLLISYYCPWSVGDSFEKRHLDDSTRNAAHRLFIGVTSVLEIT